MSDVTGVVLTCSLLDAEDTDNIHRINEWLVRRGWAPLRDLSEHATGSKHPQFFCAVAGFNHFDADGFASLVAWLPWRDPENVVLVMQPEEGETAIYGVHESLLPD